MGAGVMLREYHYERGSGLTRSNIGHLTTLSTTIPAGTHTVTCEILEDTNDPGGGHEFRLIGIMGG